MSVYVVPCSRVGIPVYMGGGGVYSVPCTVYTDLHNTFQIDHSRCNAENLRKQHGTPSPSNHVYMSRYRGGRESWGDWRSHEEVVGEHGEHRGKHEKI